MSIALTEEHQELARVARAFLESSGAREESRALLEAPSDRLPSFWKEMAELGWMGLHVDEAHGGQGFGLPELSIVLEALGFAMAPGPFLPTTLTAALVARCGSDVAREALLPGLADGSLVGAVGLGGDLAYDEDGRLLGSAGLVLGAEVAQIFAVCVGDDVALLTPDQPGLSVERQKNLDPSRRVAAVRCDGVEVSASNRLPGARSALERLARTLSCGRGGGRRPRLHRDGDRVREGARAVRPARSAPSARSSTTAPTCSSRPSRRRQAPGAPRGKISIPTRPSSQPPSRAVSPCLPSPSARSRTSRCTAASATPGSTTPTSTSAARLRSSR